LHRALREREVDVVLTRISGVEDPSVHHAPLRATPAAVYLPAGWDAAAHEPLSLADLDGTRMLCASAAGTPYTELLRARLPATGGLAGARRVRRTPGCGGQGCGRGARRSAWSGHVSPAARCCWPSSSTRMRSR